MEFLLLLLLPAFAYLAGDFGMHQAESEDEDHAEDDPLERLDFAPLSDTQTAEAHQEIADLFPDLIPAEALQGAEGPEAAFHEVWGDHALQTAAAGTLGLAWGGSYSVRNFKGRQSAPGFDTLAEMDSAEVLTPPQSHLAPIPVEDFRLGREMLLIEAREDSGVISILPMSNGDALVLMGEHQVLRVKDAGGYLIADDIRRITPARRPSAA
ncbi:hypothetical protein N6L24_04115 [Cognatishimia sp. SS12]|uniref:hypothetical protein n=1 Tax=Cognatishimia sp. SS12 TaxID=2979465 RepID=UPI00232E863D|nr:hypothetical protein [Cognatishimia sp. SS12]MDC0737449.1 hypothetical protein [Cognatishimia sp. SS12]